MAEEWKQKEKCGIVGQEQPLYLSHLSLPHGSADGLKKSKPAAHIEHRRHRILLLSPVYLGHPSSVTQYVSPQHTSRLCFIAAKK